MGHDETRIAHVVLRTARLQDDAECLRDVFQHQPLERGKDHTVYLANQWGKYSVGLTEADAFGIHHIGMRIPDVAGFERARTRAEALGAVVADVDCADVIKTLPRFTLQDPENRVVECYLEDDAPPGPDELLRVSHMVLNTTTIDTVVEFYTDLLGLQISDWTERQMAFLRSGKQHHVIAFNANAYPSINHIAFEAGQKHDFDEIVGRLGEQGVLPVWGPGRHGPGNNIFCYITLPSGVVCELVSELMEIVDQAGYRPQVWQRVQSRPDLEHLGGPPSPEAKAALAGIPDFGWMGAAP